MSDVNTQLTVCTCGHSPDDHVTRGCRGMTVNWALKAHMPCNCQGYEEAGQEASDGR